MNRTLCAVLLLLTVQAPPLESQTANTVLLPGDAVQIEVWRQPELSGEFSVGADSTILHPQYRDVKVAGIPFPEAEARVRSFLEQFESNPRFVLRPLLRVAVGGEVRQPSLYTFAPEVTIAQAVALAGGPSERGGLDRVRLVRAGDLIHLDLTDPDEPAAHRYVLSGDQILVERRTRVFRDVVVPAASITGTALSLIHLIIRIRR